MSKRTMTKKKSFHQNKQIDDNQFAYIEVMKILPHEYDEFIDEDEFDQFK